MKNRVAKLTQIRKIEIFEEEIPKLKEGQLLVAMKSVGICGSDMHYFKEGGLGSFKNPSSCRGWRLWRAACTTRVGVAGGS